MTYFIVWHDNDDFLPRDVLHMRTEIMKKAFDVLNGDQ